MELHKGSLFLRGSEAVGMPLELALCFAWFGVRFLVSCSWSTGKCVWTVWSCLLDLAASLAFGWAPSF